MRAPLLTIDKAAEIIRIACPSLRPEGLRHIGSGWDFDAFLTLDGWVFRFPRKADCAEQLDYERGVLAMVAPVLPAPVRVPSFDIVRHSKAPFEFPFARYRYLDGVDGEAAPASMLGVTARDIGAALSAIHTIPEVVARGAGARELEPDDVGRSAWFYHSLQIALGLRRLDPVVDRAIDWAASAAQAVPRYGGPLRFIHNDLGPDHLLVDGDTGALVGIIDWTDASLGDPVRDFVPLVAWQGWDFAERALSAYQLPLDASFRERMEFVARLLSVLWLANASEERGDMAKHIRWVHNSFSTDRRR